MDLEVMELPTRDRQKYQTRLRSYKTELNKLEKDAVSRASHFDFCMLMDNKESVHNLFLRRRGKFTFHSN